jgi:hypothetical protein
LAGDRRPHGESKKSAASTGLSAVIFFTDIAFFRKKQYLCLIPSGCQKMFETRHD